MLHRPWIPSLLIVLVTALAFAACATSVNTPIGEAGGSGGDTVGPGVTASASKSASQSGGQTGSTTTTTTTAVSSSSTGVPATCTKQADCVGLNGACNVGNCVNSECVPAPANEGGACDDGLFCTDNDSCAAGTCVGGTMKFCPSPDSCHVGTCDEATKACDGAPGNDGASCDDGDPCTYSGTCASGTCTKGPPVDCSNFNSTCGDGVCDPVLGCQAKPKNNGSACDDGLFCTTNDVCTNGSCAGSPTSCVGPNDPCKMGTCNEALKSCTVVAGPNGVACNDGNPCHVSATCSAGVCANGVAGNNGVACDDGNGCDKGTTCSNGVCGNPVMKINQCIAGDKCCPMNCTQANDNDCVPNYCYTFNLVPGTTGIVAAPAPFTCPTNATQWCDSTPITPTSATQAAKACQACYGAPCVMSSGDCAGPGYSQVANSGPTFGYQGGGCSMEPAGRIWAYGSSYGYYGTWAQ